MKHPHIFALVPFTLLLTGCPVSSDPTGRQTASTETNLSRDVDPSQRRAEPIDDHVQPTMLEKLSDRALSSDTQGARQILH